LLLDDDALAERFEQLAILVQSIKDIEWQRLAAADARAQYEWDDRVEGFLERLHSIPHALNLLSGLRGHIQVFDKLEALTEQMCALEAGLREIMRCGALARMLRKLLAIGNCLNAGTSSLDRADGFDVIEVLEGTLLRELPKVGDQGKSLLQYMVEVELSASDKTELQSLAATLKAWWRPQADEAGELTLADLTNEVGRISRLVGDCDAQLELAGGVQATHPDGATTGVETAMQENRQRAVQLLARLDSVTEELGRAQLYFNSMSEANSSNAGRLLRVLACLAKRLTL